MQRLLTLLLLLTTLTMSMAQKKKGTTIANDLSEQEVKDFHKRCEQVVKEFQRYIPIIANPKSDDFDKDEAIESVKGLFNEGVTIQVSSKTTGKVIPYTLTAYLRRLKDLDARYTSVTMKFYEAAKVSEFIPNPDGGYSGTATVYQEFVGRDDKNNAIYKDRTIKKINTMLNPTFDPHFNETGWKVLLGNVTVDETMEVPKQ